MKKLSLFLLVLVGTCYAQDKPSLNQLQSNARMLMVFSPDANSPAFKRQLDLIERHSYELSLRNTVVVPVSNVSSFGSDKFSFENLPLRTLPEQTDARTRFNVQPGDFVVILLDRNGAIKMRSAAPVDIHELTASLDSLPSGN